MRRPASPRPSPLATPSLNASPLFTRTLTASPLSMSDSEASRIVQTPTSLLNDDASSVFADLRACFDHELRNSLAPDASVSPQALEHKHAALPPSPRVPLLVTAPSTSTTTANDDDSDDDQGTTIAQLRRLVAASTPLSPLRREYARNTHGTIGDDRPAPLLHGSEALGPASTRRGSSSSRRRSSLGAVGDERPRAERNVAVQGQGRDGAEAGVGAVKQDGGRTREIRFSDGLVRGWLVWDVQRREVANPNLARWRELGQMMAGEGRGT